MGKISFIVLCLLVIHIGSVVESARKKKKVTSATNGPTNSANKKANNNVPYRIMWEDVAHILSKSSEKRIPLSYLFIDAHPDDIITSFIQDVVDIIHAKQHPPKNICSQKRLSVLQMTSTSFEGTGSLLKQVMLGISIAMHGNRTLIWGLGLPFIFEHTKDIWNGQNDLSKILVNNETIDCRQDDPAAGPLGCFFEPISSCALEDTAPAELVLFSEHPHNNSARIQLTEMHRGISLYHPPLGLFDFIWSERNYPAALKSQIMDKQAYIWASAVTAYVFRIKSPLLSSLTKKFSHLFPKPILFSPDKVVNREITWGIHVRHGDLKALANIYSYKEVFDFEDYFAASMKVSHLLKQTPNRLFVSTDSIEADRIPTIFNRFMSQRHKRLKRSLDEDEDSEQCDNQNEEEQAEDNDEDEGYDEDSEEYEDDYDGNNLDELHRIDRDRQKDLDQYATWWNYEEDTTGTTPSIFTIANEARYRTEHGSHTVAANGGCLRDEKYQQKGMRCALNYEAIVHYQSMDEHRSQPRSLRLMRVLLESIEDLYLLSRCDALIAQGSSHFSTLAALLIWARTLGRDSNKSFSHFSPSSTSSHLHRVYFLDQESIRVGFTPTGFLHGMNLLNGTNSVDTRSLAAGASRWQLHTHHFLTALPSVAAISLAYPMESMDIKEAIHRHWSKSSLLSVPTRLINDPSALFYLDHHFPQLNPELFYLEAQQWLGYLNVQTWLGIREHKISKHSNTFLTKNMGKYEEYLPVLPGHCPAKLRFPETTKRPLQSAADLTTVFEYIAQSINAGVDHLNLSHIGQAMECWGNAKDAITMYPEIFTKKSQKLLRSHHETTNGDGQKSWANVFQSKDELLSVIRDNMSFIRIMRYAEMAINENRNTRDYYRYVDQYMQRPYDGLTESSNKGAAESSSIDHMKSQSKESRQKAGSVLSPEGNKLFSLEDVNEEILRLEEELKKMKTLRDKLIQAHQMYMSGKIDELKKQGKVRELPTN